MSSNSHSQRYTQIGNKPSYFYVYLVGTMQHMKQKATTDTNGLQTISWTSLHKWDIYKSYVRSLAT